MRTRIPPLMLAMLLPIAVQAAAPDTKEISFSLRYAAPVVFSHSSHLASYNNCRVCHDAIFNLRERRRHTMAEMEKGRSCGACHSGVKAFGVASEKECTLCHRGRVRNVTYRVAGAGETVFSHANHLQATGGVCRSCHNARGVTGSGKPVTMAQMERGRSCGACHNGKPLFSVTANCDRCHRGMKPADVTFKLKGVAAARFSHSRHTPSFTCRECHTSLFPYRATVGKATMDDMARGRSCGACHNGTDAFASSGDCRKCHPGYRPARISFKTGGGEAAFSHDSHLANYACADCHTRIFPYRAGALKATMAQMEQGASCGACHNRGKDAFPVQGDCEKCHRM